MKYIFFIFIIASVGANAQWKLIPFKNQYSNYPDTVQSNLNYNDTWSKMISFMQKNSCIARIVDKSTGILSIEMPNCKVASEDKNGKIDTGAFAVVQKIYSVARNKIYSLNKSSIVWNLHIDQSNSTIIIDSMKLLDARKIYSYNFIWDVFTSKDHPTPFFPTDKFTELIKEEVQ